MPAACVLGAILLAVGVLLGWLAGMLPAAPDAMPWRSGLVASALAGCVLAYDGFSKKTPLGPVAMGSCRFLNVLLGMSAGQPAADGLLLGYGAANCWRLLGIGVYIVGVTWFSRQEAGMSRGAVLFAALVVMMVGVALFGASLLYVHYAGFAAVVLAAVGGSDVWRGAARKRGGA